MAKPSNKRLKLFRAAAERNRTLAKLDAILSEADALANGGRTDDALRLLERNLARFPNSADLRATLATLYGFSAQYDEAAEQARMAVDLAPRRPELHLLAAMAYESAGYHSFASRHRRTWLKAAPRGELLPLMQALDADYLANMESLQTLYALPGMDFAERAGLLLDEGRWALSHDRWSEALEHSRAAGKLAPKWPPPRNNVTVALIYLERYREASEEARKVLRELDADNVHALANLVHMSVILQEPGEAAQAADRLASLPPAEDPEELDKQIQGLAWLDRDADIGRLLKMARRKRVTIGPAALVHWGVAEANDGRRREALAHLRAAEEAGVGAALLLDTLEGLEARRAGPGISLRYPQTHFSDLLPVSAVRQALALIERQGKTGFRDQSAWDKYLAKYPQFVMAAERIMYEAPDGAESGARLLLEAGEPGAKEVLLRFVGGQVGGDETRMQVLQLMQQARMIGSDEPVEMWLRGARQPVMARLIEISDKFGEDYSEEAIEIYVRAGAAHKRREVAEAIRLYRHALSVQPDLKEAYNNLGVLLAEQGDTAGSQECIEKALAIDPLYAFPLAARALQSLYRDGPGAAREILKPLGTVEHWQPLEMVVYQKALVRIALEERDYHSARTALELVRQINPDDPDLKNLMTQVETIEMFDPQEGWFAGMDERSRDRRRRKSLPPDPSLSDCLGTVSVGDMVGMAHALRLGLPSPRRRALVEQHMLTWLQDPELVGAAVGALDEKERDALQAILDTCGVLAWERFVELFGDERADRPYLEYWAEHMKSVPGRLRARGLIFYGTIEGEEVVAIPREVRGPAAEALGA